MSDVRILDYVRNVETNRQRLIQNCRNRGKAVSANASLTSVVTANNTIEENPSVEPSTACVVRYFDIDGTILLKYVLQPDEILPAAPAAPAFDSSFLIFDKWKASAGLTITDSGTIVKHNVDIGAQYKVKEQVEIDGVLIRPTILKCCFNSITGLSPTLNYKKTSSAPLYIDWGDGTINTITSTATTGSQAHTYSNPGNYNIRLYSTADYGFGTNSSKKYVLNSATYNQALMYVYIGDNVTSIDENAFYQCYALTSVVIPDSVTSIGASVFYYCYALTSIVIPDSVTFINNGAFYYCYALTPVVLSNNITSIGGNTFVNCGALTSIVLPDNVTSIGSSAFYCCYALTSIVFPNSLTSMTKQAFYGCRALTSIVLPNSLTTIVEEAFMNCGALTSIVLPNKLTSIGSKAFYGCYALTSIVIPDSVKSIGDNTFYYCYALPSIVIPNNVTSIGSSIFYYCGALTSIVLPDNVTSIGSSAFSGCGSLTSIVLPNSLTSLGSGAFSSCYALTSIVLPDNFNINLSLTNCRKLTTECYVHIANQLADLTGASAKVISFAKDQNAKLYGIYVHSATGELCEASDEGAINIITFMQNKNWTVNLY